MGPHIPGHSPKIPITVSNVVARQSFRIVMHPLRVCLIYILGLVCLKAFFFIEILLVAMQIQSHGIWNLYV